MFFNRIGLYVVLCILSFPSFANSEKITFAAAPTHSAVETDALYKPILDYLSKKTGKEFVLDIPATFIEYSNKVKAGEYDLAFDGPHLAGWRIEHRRHTPIIKVPGQIKIVVVTKENSRFSKLEDLQYGARVCAFTPPNMLTMAMLSYFPNELRQPRLVAVKQLSELMKCVKDDRGVAAVIRAKMWNKAKKAGSTQGLRLLAAPERAYPERTITAGPRVDEEMRKEIIKLLISDEGQTVAAPLLKKLNKKSLVEANLAEYEGLARLVGSVWGYH